MSRPWPSGPDGQPLPADQHGEPAWPSDSYRLAYEAGEAQQIAAADRRKASLRRLATVVVAAIIVVFIALTIRSVVTGPQQAQQHLCQFDRDNNIPPSPGECE